jgi:class 3 adenylate cyclase
LSFAPELKNATVLFSDVVGFAGISERLPEDRLAHWLNDYLAAMVKIIDRHGGGVEKFVGDGITAGFGVSETHNTPDNITRHAQAAVDAAQEMATDLLDLNVRWQQEGLPEIGVRIGIDTGPLMIGVIGTDVRWQYTFIGDTANTAARLESYGKDDPDLTCAPGDCRIFISGSTWERLGSSRQTTFIGDIKLRSKAKLVSVYRVEC